MAEDMELDDFNPSQYQEADTDEAAVDLENRKEDYSGLAKVKTQLADVYDAVVKGFEDKESQNRTIDRAWDVYNCEANDQQSYFGDSTIYVPLVRDAVEARVTRFTGQLFPQSGRYADVVGVGDGEPWDIMALLDSYVDRVKLKSVVIPALLREGDCSGQYSLYIDWTSKKRHIVTKKFQNAYLDQTGRAIPGDTDEFEDRKYEEISDEKPDVVVLDARNLCILPTNVDEVEDADIVAVAVWYTKTKIKQLQREGVFEKKAVEALMEAFDQANAGSQHPDTEKKNSAYAGVKADSKGSKRAMIYRVWTKVKIKGEYRLCEIHYAGKDNILSCKRLPFWNDRIPVISKPVIKVPGSIWGKSPVQAVEKLQYQANDAVNIGMDSAKYGLLPIVMTDPERNPRIGSMVLAQAAIWETNPNDTQIVQFPPLYKEALTIVSVCKDQIMQSLSVNSSMMPNTKGKPSQAQVAQEQQVALMTTNVAVSVLQEGVLDAVLQWFYDLDYQFRTKEMTVKAFGQMGIQADMQQIPVFRDNIQYMFRWIGTEANKSVEQVQQMIAAMNVFRGIPPEQMPPGMKLDLAPILEHVASVAFGPRIAPKILKDQRSEQSLNPEVENQLMLNGFPTPVHAGDNDAEHVQAHMVLHSNEAPNPFVHQHVTEHLAQMKQKSAPPEPPKGAPGVPGGAGPGVAGSPRPGAQPGMPRMQQPPGAIHKDNMPLAMPRAQ